MASFSLIIIKNPDIESVKLWIASEAIARELDSIPTTILKMANRKLVKIKK